MKSSFLQRKPIKCMLIILIFTILFYVLAPNYVSAESSGLGGLLLEPIKDLFLALGDAAMLVMNYAFYDLNISTLLLDKTMKLSDVLLVIFGVIAAIAAVALIIATGGAGLIALAGTIGVTVSSTAVAVVAVVKGISLAVLAISTIAVGVTYYAAPDKFYVPIYLISPQEIFTGEIEVLDVNFINPKGPKVLMGLEPDGSLSEIRDKDGNEITTEGSIAYQIHDIIASWYATMLMVAIIGMMLVLAYIGFRIILSSTSQDKAKYKSALTDWVVACCLLFTLHYIMAFSNRIVESIVNAMAKNAGKVELTFDASAMELTEEEIQKLEQTGAATVDNGELKLNTNLTGYARIEAQWGSAKEGLKDNPSGQLMHNVAYTVLFFILVIYTAVFTLVYLKRVAYMAFLTLIAPLVAMYYPIDKMSDGQAQGWNTWLREYIYNLLIQPFHLLLYMVLVGSAMEIAKDNLIYPIAVLGLMFPLEHFIRQLFQLQKASTTKDSSSTADTLLKVGAMGALSKLLTSGGKDKKKDKDSDNNSDIRTQEALPEGAEGEESEGGIFEAGSGNDDSDTFTDTDMNDTRQIGEQTRRVGTSTIGTGRNSPKTPIWKKPDVRLAGHAALKVGKFVAKTGARIIGFGVGAAGGLMQGIAMGKPGEGVKNALTYGAGGVGTVNAGMGIGKRIAGYRKGKLPSFKDARGQLKQGITDYYNKKQYGTTNKDTIKFIQDHKKDFKASDFQDAVALREAGISDVKAIQAGINMQRNGLNYTSQRTVTEKVQQHDETGRGIIGQYKDVQRVKTENHREAVTKDQVVKMYKAQQKYAKQGGVRGTNSATNMQNARKKMIDKNTGVLGEEKATQMADRYIAAFRQFEGTANQASGTNNPT